MGANGGQNIWNEIKKYIPTAIFSIVAFIAGAVWYGTSDIKSLGYKIDGVKESLSTEIGSHLDDFTRYKEKHDAQYDEMYGSIERMYGYNMGTKSTVASMTNAAAHILEVDESERNFMYCLDEPKWDDNEIIATIENTGVTFSADELENQPLVLTRVAGPEILVFSGQYDSYNRWNGKCIINVYEDNKLEFIMDAYYEHGELSVFRQVFKDTTSRGDEVWVVSNRINKDGYSTGETWNFLRTEEYIKEFDIEDISYDDVVSLTKFKTFIKGHLESYYNGNISDGYYNDDTGRAYLVKYFEDGTVRMLYQGNFVNGRPNDNTGNAWYLLKEEGTAYMYHTGEFVDGTCITTETKKNFQNYLTKDDINSYLSGKYFDCPLMWDVE